MATLVRPPLWLVAGVVGTLALAHVAAAALEPAADYRFQNSRLSSVAGVPSLVDIGPGTNEFGRELVAGERRSVLRFPRGNGVSLPSATEVIPRQRYTIVVLFNFDRVSGFRRIVDLHNGGPDRGLYLYNGRLDFWPIDNVGPTRLAPDRYYQVVLTRTAAGRVTAFVDGVRQWRFDDSVRRWAVIGRGNAVRFFRDNETGFYTSEHAPGAVARIQLFDHALTAGEVAVLPNTRPNRP